MRNEATLSTIIDANVKKAVTQFCKSRGIKLRHFIEQSLFEQLEDAIDLEAYRKRRFEETIPLSQILTHRKVKK